MTTTDLTRLLATGRLAYGVCLVLAPRRAAGVWIGQDAARPATQLAIRALGVRDAALGAGVLASSPDASRLRPWIAGAAISDLVDGLATLAAPKGAISPTSRWATVLIAMASAAAGAAIYSALE